MRLELTTFGIVWIVSVGWWPHGFSVFRLRVLDTENECPGLITIFEISSGGFVLSLDYYVMEEDDYLVD